MQVVVQADVALAPGPHETFGLAALEALASGTPAVVSRTSALAEILTSDSGATADNDPLADAIAVGRVCDEVGCYWYEDPFLDAGWSPHAARQLKEHVKTPLLLTEHVRGLEPKAPWITAGATDFLRCDPDYDMGITGAMKTAHLAEAFGLDCEIHAAGPAQRHCMAAMRNSNWYELSLVAPDVANPVPPVFGSGYSDALEAIGPDGCFPVPTEPGLGVALDREFIRARRGALRAS
mgnify:CR=1 FL=1